MRKASKRKVRPLLIHKAIMQHESFEQIDRLMLMINNANVTADGADVVMREPNGEVYQVAPALNTFCDYWQSIASMHNVSFDDAPLRTLINKINHDMPLTQSLINQAKAVVEKQRALFMRTPNRVLNVVSSNYLEAMSE
jgi:hypothetical protein